MARAATELAKSCDDPWIAEAYRLLGYALRESSGSIDAQRDAFTNYIGRTLVDDDRAKEAKKLLIPMRRH